MSCPLRTRGNDPASRQGVHCVCCCHEAWSACRLRVKRACVVFATVAWLLQVTDGPRSRSDLRNLNLNLMRWRALPTLDVGSWSESFCCLELVNTRRVLGLQCTQCFWFTACCSVLCCAMQAPWAATSHVPCWRGECVA
jgi:hypothetical protein